MFILIFGLAGDIAPQLIREEQRPFVRLGQAGENERLPGAFVGRAGARSDSLKPRASKRLNRSGGTLETKEIMLYEPPENDFSPFPRLRPSGL